MSRVLLDTLDECRRELRGLSGADIDKIYNEMPVFVACGAQSSGKSAIISRLCGFDLPQSSQLCTRVVVEIELRRSEQQVCEVYVLGHNNQEEDRRAVSSDDLPAAVKELQDKIVASASSTFITDKRIVVRVEGPDKINVTLVDLPGLHSDKTQGVDEVRKITETHISRPSVLALHVVKADQDYGSILGADVVTDSQTLNRITVLTHCDRLSGDPSERIRATLDRTAQTSLRTFAVAGREEFDEGANQLADLDPRLDVGVVALREAVESALLDKLRTQLPIFKEVLMKNLAVATTRLEGLALVNDYDAVYKTIKVLRTAFDKVFDIYEKCELRERFEKLCKAIRDENQGDLIEPAQAIPKIKEFQKNRGTMNSVFSRRHEIVVAFLSPYADAYGRIVRNHLDLLLGDMIRKMDKDVWPSAVMPVAKDVPQKMNASVKERLLALRDAFDVHVELIVEANTNPLSLFTPNDAHLHELIEELKQRATDGFTGQDEWWYQPLSTADDDVKESYYHTCAFLKVQRVYVEEHLSKVLVLFYSKLKKAVFDFEVSEFTKYVIQAPESKRHAAEANVAALKSVLDKLRLVY